MRVGYNRFSGGPVSGQAAPHQISLRHPERDQRAAAGGRPCLPQRPVERERHGASEETRHIYIGDSGGRGEDIHPSLTDFRIEYNRISDSVRRRGIYTKRGGTVSSTTSRAGPGCDRHPHRRARLVFRQSLRQHRFRDHQRPRPPGPGQLGPRAQGSGPGMRVRQRRRWPFHAAHRAMVVGNDARSCRLLPRRIHA